MGILFQKPLVAGKLSMFSGMYNDALMHRGEKCKGSQDFIIPGIHSIKYSEGILLYCQPLSKTTNRYQTNSLVAKIHSINFQYQKIMMFRLFICL